MDSRGDEPRHRRSILNIVRRQAYCITATLIGMAAYAAYLLPYSSAAE